MPWSVSLVEFQKTRKIDTFFWSDRTRCICLSKSWSGTSQKGDISFVCVIHCLVHLWLGWTISLY